MNITLIIRPELFSIFIMIFLIIYDRYCAKFRPKTTKNDFFKLALVCLGHCIMAFITEITVNMDGLSKYINDGCHILLFLFSLLFCLYYFEYALSLIIPDTSYKKVFDKIIIFIGIAGALIMLLSPINYYEGKGTSYSGGIGVTLCFSLGFLFLIAANILIIINHKRIRKNVIITTLPLSLITLAFLIVQLIIPEFLFTAQSLTITALGLFFAIENPIEKIITQSFIDVLANTWNRNCFEHDLEHYITERISSGSKMTFIMGDINGLKQVNDTLGHQEGDSLIRKTADIIRRNMASSYKVYRIGGDEFVIIYFNTDISVVEKEINGVQTDCSGITFEQNLPVGISIGYAELTDGKTISDTATQAEKMLYENKRKYYDESGRSRRLL